MTTFTGTKGRVPKHMQAMGNAYKDDDSVSVPSTFTTTDKARLILVPAGTRVTDLTIRNTDLDSGATITANYGYEAADAGSALAASANYFGAANTNLRTAGRTELDFAPITFEEDVWITCTPAAGPATTAGTIGAIVDGIVVGIK